MFNLRIQFIVLFIILFLFRISSQSNSDSKHILYINSYDFQMNWSQNILDGFVENLDKENLNLKTHFEAMDSKDFHSEEYYDEFRRYLEIKYNDLKFSLIICSDNNAFDFLLNNHKTLYPDVPVIFCGINNFDKSVLIDHKEFTGLTERPSISATVDLALKLHRGTKEVYVINDYLKTGRALQKQIKADLEYLDHNTVKLLFSDNLSINELLQKVANLSDNTIILLEGYYSDKNGYSSNYEKMAELIAGASNVPIYTCSNYNIQSGVVGGKVLRGYYYGEIGAQMAIRILNGESPSDIPIVSSQISQYIFNYPELVRFSISEKDLPKDSFIINRPFSIYESYKWRIWIVFVFILTLLVLLILAVSNIIKRTRIERTLRELADATWEGICIHHKGVALQANEMLSEIFGYSQEEILGELFLEKIISDQSLAYVKKIIDSDLTVLYEAIGKRNDGSTFPIEIRVRRIHYKGLPARVAAIRDLTDQKLSEQNLQYLVKFLEENPAPIIRLSSSGTINYSNQSAKNEIIGEYFIHDKPDPAWFNCDLVRKNQISDIEISSNKNFYKVNFIYTTNNDVFLYFLNITTEKEYVYLESFMNILFENSLEAVFFLDSNKKCERVNHNAAILTGFTKEELIENPVIMFDESSNPENFSSDFYTAVSRNGSWSGELVHRKKSGETYIACLNVTTFKSNPYGEIKYMAIFHDISERKKREDDLLWMTKYDMLTGFTNRNFFHEILYSELKASQRSGEICAIILLNIDGLKSINNKYGCRVGDLVIKEFSKRLTSVLREEDTVSRFGGDEFAVLAPRFKEKNQVNQVVNRIRQTVLRPVFLDDLSIDLSISIGIALSPSDGVLEEELLIKSGIALKRTKVNRKGSFSLYNSEQDKATMRNIELALDLKKAFLNEELDVYFQPKVNPVNEKIEGCEALMRWDRKQLGFVPPGVFIPILEENGLIVDIGYFIIERVCDFLLKLRERGILDIHVSINISAKQFSEPDFISRLLDIVESRGIESSNIDLEITESITASGVFNIIESLTILSDRGFSISIDDFGTGYSSLQYLVNLPFNTIKIDKSFIDEIPKGKDHIIILKTMISLAHSLKKSVVAEGVETKEQLDFLKENNCELIQGHYYFEALPMAEILELF